MEDYFFMELGDEMSMKVFEYFFFLCFVLIF